LANQIAEVLINLAHRADGLASRVEYWRWYKETEALLEQVAPQLLSDFRHLSNSVNEFDGLAAQKGMLLGAALKLKMETGDQTSTLAPTLPVAAQQSKKVFVVHGHDSEAKESAARFIERLELEAIILHEQPNAGRTVIEKFEQYTDVGFAVVLLTPDDVGAAKDKRASLQPRARQNVVLELGYFLGKLGRSRVCALYKSGVEIPSDFDGVLYIELDDKGAWRTKLAQELSNARVPFNVEAVLKF